jgi:hypothetical protein
MRQEPLTTGKAAKGNCARRGSEFGRVGDAAFQREPWLLAAVTAERAA